MTLGRWTNYCVASGDEFTSFWKTMASERDRTVLLIGGGGFDPRSARTVEALSAAGVKIGQCRLIRFSESVPSASRRNLDLADSNVAKIQTICGAEATMLVEVEMRTADGRSVGGRRISELFQDPADYTSFTDIVVDVTGLPRGLYFPLLGTLMALFDEGRVTANIHVAVCESAEVDETILSEGGDKAEWIHGFTGGNPLAGSGDAIRIWAPILGGAQSGAARRVAEFVEPAEFHPILPFPAYDPSRADQLMVEYRELLFDAWQVEAGAIIYANEHNPFDVYRRILALTDRYAASLKPLGEARTVPSTHSSKSLSIGALLAAYERGIGVAHVEPTGYVLTDAFEPDQATGVLYEIWLTGEAYEDN